MLGITSRDRKRSTWIREKTRVKDIIQTIKQQKLRWAGHEARMSDDRWTKRITDWLLYNDKRSKKRPDSRWRDEIEKIAGVTVKELHRISSYGRNWERPSFSSGRTKAATDDDYNWAAINNKINFF